jgi:poly(3-hydroxybutyrate) depolymerase
MRRGWKGTAVACVLALASVAHARGKGAPRRPAEWSEEAGRQVVSVHDPCTMRAFLHVPEGLGEAGGKAALVVILHGHGGTPTGMLGYGAALADARGEVWMACEGTKEIATDRGPGRAWNPATDVGGVLACVDAALERLPLDPRRVVVMGHSAGGTMSLLACAERRSIAGVHTTAAPVTPSSAQKGARVVVTLGTRDPNYAGFPAARQAAEKQVVGRLVAVDGLGHDLPDALYTSEALDWILDGRGGSEELFVPQRPSEDALPPPGSPASKEKGGSYRHVLKFVAGGRRAPEDALARAAVRASLVSLASGWKRSGADFGDAVATESQDPVSRELRGVVTGAVLARYGGALSKAMGKLEGGETSPPVESDAGWHLVHRDP